MIQTNKDFIEVVCPNDQTHYYRHRTLRTRGGPKLGDQERCGVCLKDVVLTPLSTAVHSPKKSKSVK